MFNNMMCLGGAKVDKQPSVLLEHDIDLKANGIVS